MAQVRVKQAQQKPFFGKPYLKLGQCLALWGYFFQMGGVLGARHTASPDTFGPAFLGAQGEAGAVRRFFKMVAEEMVDQTVYDSTTIPEYVISESMKRLGFAGTPHDFMVKFGMQKIKPDTAAEVAWQFAEQGAAFGAVFPQK